MRATKRLPTKIDRLIEILDSLPDDEVLTIWDVMELLQIGRRETVYDWARHNVRLSFYSFLDHRGSKCFYVFGNPRGIIAARKYSKQLENQ
jgi:hypothetical protein